MAFTTSTDSSNFESSMVTGFLEDVHEEFVCLVADLAGYLGVLHCVLQLTMDFGRGVNRSSTISTEPHFGLREVPHVQGGHVYQRSVNRLLRQKVRVFLQFLRFAFQEMVNTSTRRAAVLAADLRIGEGNHWNISMRLSPMSLSQLPVPLSPSSTNRDSETSVDIQGSAQDGDPIHFYPIPRGHGGAFFARFNPY